MPKQTEIVNAPYQFTELEMVQNAKELAASMGKLDQIASKKKAFLLQIKEEEETTTGRIEELTNMIRTGTEQRDYVCEIEYDFANRVKRYVREEDGAVLETRQLNQKDWQMKMEMDAEEKDREFEEQMKTDEEGYSEVA